MTTTAIRRNPESIDDALLEKYQGQAAALMHEALGKRGAFTNDFRPAWPGARCVGRALTVQGWPGDNLMLHKAISLARPGDVLVAAVNGFTEGGLWGEIATIAAMEKGIQGLVTDGAVRDVDPIQKLGFGVFSRGLSIKGTTKKQGGLINHPISIGGVIVYPGDIIVADGDGVVSIPFQEAASALESAAQIEAREAEIIAGIRRGELTIDLLGLRDALQALGLDDN